MKDITKERILRDSNAAFENDEFVIYYQPQYNALTGMIVGTEALVRWNHGALGLLSPYFFIDVFEQNDIISRLDLLVYEKVCAFLKKCIDDNITIIPVSVNLSRKDLYNSDYISKMEEIRNRYGIPVKLIRLEVVESIASEGVEAAMKLIEKLHSMGYVVELDDFGSGYSSLSMLKDIHYDILKLDMNFLSGQNSDRGGTILSSIVRMAKWLKMPVIAEGVETKEQLDYLKSIGCEYIQGYLYSKPKPEDEYIELLKSSSSEQLDSSLRFKNAINPSSFWDINAVETLIFNSFVGAAAVFRYTTDGDFEYLQVNNKYVRELQMNMSENDVVYTNLWDSMDEENKKKYQNMISLAISTGDEQECETWRNITSSCCGDETLCIRSTVSVIGKSDDEYILYAVIRNVTHEKENEMQGRMYESQFKRVIEQVNIYYWEYTVATKEMRPCFRCMRDLGLPPVVKNYPEPAIADGIFPQDYADMYRDWHKQIAQGVDHLEAVIPLTVGRVPFRVRYTTEFDELGRPVKAYGSATLVTDDN